MKAMAGGENVDVPPTIDDPETLKVFLLLQHVYLSHDNIINALCISGNFVRTA